MTNGSFGSLARPVSPASNLFDGPPLITSPRRIGWYPDTPFVHTFSAIGERPRTISVRGLPNGVVVDPETGVASGVLGSKAGAFTVEMVVENSHGRVSEDIEIVLGEDLVLTPPLGWNSWNLYAHDVDAAVIKAMADAMVSNGMRDLGYGYINIDDFWHAESRHPDGTPAANTDKFPDGISAVADYLHDKGLKLGIYSDAAEKTCGGCFGGLGYEQIDARTYAEWGVDLLKYDYCYAPKSEAIAARRYSAMSEELRNSGRSIALSVCEWGFRKPWNWASRLGGAYWRTTPDIFDTFHAPVFGVKAIAKKNLSLGDFAGPGRWNDPDMLLVGNRGKGLATGSIPLTFGKLAEVAPRPRVPLNGITDQQSHTHMTLWAIMASPLLTSNDLANMCELDFSLLSNPEVLAINQDSLGHQGRLIGSHGDAWLIRKDLVDGDLALAATNMGNKPEQVSVSLAELSVRTPALLRDVWDGSEQGEVSNLSVELAPYESRMWRLSIAG